MNTARITCENNTVIRYQPKRCRAVAATVRNDTQKMKTAILPRMRHQLAVGEIFSFAYETFASNKVRFTLTALGMVIGTASLILVVTIGMTGRQYALNQIQAIGTNEIWAEYLGGAQHISGSTPDPLTIEDLAAVQQEVPGIVASSPIVRLSDRIPAGNGKEKDVTILGVAPEYLRVRNLVIPSGRFFDNDDSLAHNKVALITERMAIQIYGSAAGAVGHVIKLTGLPFTVIGTFKERVETFGQTEIEDNTMLIPYSVTRYFMETPSVSLAYFSMADSSMVVAATPQIKRVIQSRHRAESVYSVQNLTAVLAPTNREIRFQFLSEAILISLIGGVLGIIIGLAIPFSVRFLTAYRIPISGLSAIIAIVVSSLVGILFGTLPAIRASQLDPVESLRYE